jgi:hypothetical protein
MRTGSFRQIIVPLAGLFVVLMAGRAPAQPIVEGFENVAALQSSGWVFINASTEPDPANIWQQGDAVNLTFPAQAGTQNSYAVATFESTMSMAMMGATISNWLITPLRSLANGNQFSFFTRKPRPTGATDNFPDRMQVRLSTSTAAPSFTDPNDVGTFTTLLLDINPALDKNNNDGSFPPGYPTDWTQFTVTLSGLPAATQGRIAFRYFVINGGPQGANSDAVAIDTFVLTTAVPEPGALALAGLAGTAGLGVVRRGRAARSK